MYEKYKIIISGGGTGGHIFPAIAIANAIKEKYPKAQILFVGAEGRMEMQRVPAAGYEIKALPIKGFNRKHIFKNINVLFHLWKSIHKARTIIKEFQPQVAVGVGGYASGATLYECSKMKIPYLLQEQNSYAGVTNKLLSKKAKKICVAYDGMERFFNNDKIILTGNPVRQNVINTHLTKEEAIKTFDLDPNKKTILIVGGSLGAYTINKAMLENINIINNSNIQFIWQTGKYYHNDIKEALKNKSVTNLKILDFISDMGTAYKAADLVISRAGASSISEFQLIGKPIILVPSPNVAEDHQTKNAMALVNKKSALMVKDSEAQQKLIPLAIETVQNENKINSLSTNIKKMGIQNSANKIADEVIKLIH